MNLPVLTNNNERVLTTKQLAEVYETKENNIVKNFSNNKNRFIEGKHYYLLKGDELKEFKNLVNDIHVVDKRTPSLILWTEKGASRMCKILDTDKAWAQFDILEETYFNVKKNINKLPSNDIDIADEIEIFGAAAKILNLNDCSKLAGVQTIYKEHNLSTKCLPVYAKSKGILKSATALLKENNVNLSVIQFNKKLVSAGILRECERTSTKGKIKKFKNLVDTTWGENQSNPKSPRETQPMYYEDKFKELIKLLNI